MNKNNIYIYLILLIAGSSLTLNAQGDCFYSGAEGVLAGNNVEATLLTNGSFWWDGRDGRYLVPAQSGISSIFAGGLWLGGLDEGDNLRVAANTYGASPNWGASDFFPGPLNPQTGFTELETCEQYNRFWPIKRTEIEAFLDDWNDNGQIDDVIPVNVLLWPGRENPHLEPLLGFSLYEDRDMATFFDRNQDGIYNPIHGDYPLIKGADQALWWVFNDRGNAHTITDGVPMGVEVHALAYSYNSNTSTAVNNATYYDLKFINRGEEDLQDFYAAMWVDVDLGCAFDDYFGCAPEHNMVFMYNQDAVDGIAAGSCDCAGTPSYCGEVPLMGIKVLQGLITEDGTDLGLSSFTYYNNGGANPPPEPGTSDPHDPSEFYNLMQGRRTDGDFWIDPTTGEASPFAQTGNPVDEQAWSMCHPMLGGGDRRLIFGSGPVVLEEDASQELSFALIYVPDVPHPCPDITPLLDACAEIEDVLTTSSKEVQTNSPLIHLFPNPMQGESSILQVDPQLQLSRLELYDYKGQLLRQYENFGQELILRRDNLTPSLYFYRAYAPEQNQYFTGKILVQ